jgi:type IV secretion system protein VirB9
MNRIAFVLWLTAIALFPSARADEAVAQNPADAARDPRIRVVPYDPDHILYLSGVAGYQIDLQFQPGESFVGLAAGDIQAIDYVAQDNHLFLKPKAPRVRTNLTVLTNRRQYLFDYDAMPKLAEEDSTLYAIRFTYPPARPNPHADDAAKTMAALAKAAEAPPRNIDYWYCGNPALKPTAASDDGLHTRIRFLPNAELPAIFVRNDDSTESLLNFSIQEDGSPDAGDVIIHRVAHRFILRRGKLTGCIVNQGFQGSGERRSSHTLSPAVQRHTRPVPGDAP